MLTDLQLKQLAYRQRILPVQLQAAYRKVEMLENEARRYGFLDLIKTD